MQEHLTNEQLTEYLTDPLASGGDATIREHLAACAACRNEAGRLHSLLALYGEVTRAAGARPQAFWQWQRTTILTGLESRPVPRRLVWAAGRSEEHTSELQSRPHLVCRLLLEKKKRSR